MTRHMRGALAAGLLIAIGACSSPARVGKQPSWRTGAKSKRSAPTHSIVKFAPSTPAVESYNDPTAIDAPETPLSRALLAEITAMSAELGKPAPIVDARLTAAVNELAVVAPQSSTLAYGLVEFAMQRHGIVEPSPHLIVMIGPADQPDVVINELRGRLPAILAATDFQRFAVGTAPTDTEGESSIVIALQSSFIEMLPIPRWMANGGVARLEGKVHPPFTDPHVFITRDDGKVWQPPMTRIGKTGFRAELDCGERSGKQQVEITAADATGSTVLANFPVWCRQRAPTLLTIDTSEDDGPPASEAEAEDRMLELVNRDRAEHNLPPLKLDKRVATVARAHSRDMMDTGIVAHVSPNTGNASDRIAGADIKTSVVLENVARAYGVGEAEAGLMNSPGHRANILSEQATHIGVGIVLGDHISADRRELFVTQLFTRVAQPIDKKKVWTGVRASIVKEKSLVPDTELDQLAAEFAAALARGEPTDKAAKASNRQLDRLSGKFRRVTTVITTMVDIGSFDPHEAITDQRVTHFGLGVGQGDHKEMGDGAVFIVILLGQK